MLESITYAWAVVIVCAWDTWERDGLVGGTRLGAIDTDLRTGRDGSWIELGSAECQS